VLSCEYCKNSYRVYIENYINYIGCNIVDKYRNPSLRTLGEECKCPYYKIKDDVFIGGK